ncbi:sterol desaturase family protein [Robertkochia flava]|uniref:sterol desaturase family protein n=1 Tax=Robertkochia flava TaxID=3447986 RepID=UPI001CCFA7A8|nr:sterol desaturase family protein [Robertkochia marina]
METYANALLYAIPLFIGLVLTEILYGHFTGKQTHTVMDTVSSLSSGLTNIIKDSLGLAVVLVSYPFLLEHLAVFEIRSSWIVYTVGFIAIDFAGYWNHRLSHKVNIFWNQHVIHHSSEEFNLACALRQSISNIIGYFPLLLIPAALLGVPAKVIAILAPLQLFLQFWYHTRHIGKLGWLEYIIVTPSQHRVHHAINPEYIDKNLGQIFSVWDRMFGTFQEELDEVPPVYGVLKPAATWNPVIINFQHFWRLLKDAWNTRNWFDKLRIWVMPTGWRPQDVRELYPYDTIKDVYHFEKYDPEATPALKGYAIFQLLFSTVLMLFMFYNYAEIGFDGLLLFGFFVFTGIFGYSSLMDGHPIAPWIEGLRSLAGISYILLSGSWFGIEAFLPYGNLIMIVYFLFTMLSAIYFSVFEKTNRMTGLA